MIMSYKAFLRNFREKYSGEIFRNLYNSVPKTIRKIVGQVMRVTKEFPKKFSIISWDKFRNITKNQITKIRSKKDFEIGDQFWKIMQEFLMNQSQETCP